MKNWKKLGDAASAAVDRLSDKAKFEGLARKFRDLCDDAIDGGIRPSKLFAVIGATLTYRVVQMDSENNDAVAQTLNNMVSEVMRIAAETREAVGELPQ